MRRAAAFFLTGILLAAAPSGARAADDPPAGASDRLKKVSPEEKARLAERLARWKAMSEEQRTKLRERLQSFRTLPEDEKAEIAERAKAWKDKAPERKGEIEHRFDLWLGFSGLRKDVLLQRFKALSALPEEERRKLLALPEPQKTAEFQKVFLLHEVRRLLSRLSPEERKALEGLEPVQQRERALAVFRDKRAAQLQRLPDALRRAWAELTPAERGKAEERALRELAFRDQKLLAVLPPAARDEFLKMPVAHRDELAVRALGAVPEEKLNGLSAEERRAIDAASPAEKPWRVLDALFARTLRRAFSNLLPSQQRALRDLPPAKQWERAQGFLKENHRRLLARIPQALRAELEGLPADAQARRVRAWLDEESKKHPPGRHARGSLQELPLLLRLDAFLRLKKEAGRDGRKKD